eukprot:gene23858-9418_t
MPSNLYHWTSHPSLFVSSLCVRTTAKATSDFRRGASPSAPTNKIDKPAWQTPFLSPHKKPPVSPPQPLESKLISVRDMTLEALANTTTYDKRMGVKRCSKRRAHIVLGVNKMITIVVGGLFGDDEEEEKTAEEVDTMQAVVGPLQANDVIVVVVAVGSQNEAKPSHVDVEIGMKELKQRCPPASSYFILASMFSKALTGCNAMMSRTSVMTSLACSQSPSCGPGILLHQA